MNCQTILQNELHEKYLLGRLKEDERNQYERHLGGCETCRSEAEAQQRLISGLQEIGREEMKSEIRRQVEAQKTPVSEVHWMRWAKIAAVLLLVITTPSLFYIYRKTTPELVPAAFETPLQPAPMEENAFGETGEKAQQAKKETLPAERVPAKVGPVSNRDRRTAETHRNENQALAGTAPLREKSDPLKDELAPQEPAAANLENPPTQEQTSEQKVDLLKSSLASTPSRDVVADSVRSARRLRSVSQGPGAVAATVNRGKVATYRYDPPQRVDRLAEKRVQEKEGETAKQRVAAPARTWRFTTNGRSVRVNLIQTEIDFVAKAGPSEDGRQLPQSFEVEIVSRDSLHFEFNWLVGPAFLKLIPEELRIEISPDQIMRVMVPDRFSYKIDLNGKADVAVLERDTRD